MILTGLLSRPENLPPSKIRAMRGNLLHHPPQPSTDVLAAQDPTEHCTRTFGLLHAYLYRAAAQIGTEQSNERNPDNPQHIAASGDGAP